MLLEQIVALRERIDVIVNVFCGDEVNGEDDAHTVELEEADERMDTNVLAERLPVAQLLFVARLPESVALSVKLTVAEPV